MSAPGPFEILLVLAIVAVAAVVGIVLWLTLRKKPQARGFEVIQSPPQKQAEERE